MREFTLTGFAAFLSGMVVAVESAKHEALEKAAKIIEAEAKSEIGTYQGAAGPFAAWAPLKPATIAKKATGDKPLLETGEMRDSIAHTIGQDEAEVGSNNDKALWQELGTSRGIPPRSFLGHAAVVKEPEVVNILGGSVVQVLMGGIVPKRIT